MTLNDYLKTYSLFESGLSLPFLSTTDQQKLTLYIKNFNGMQELYFPADEMIESNVQLMVTSVLYLNNYKLNKLYNTLNLSYTMTDTTDYTHTVTESDGGQETHANTSTHESHNTGNDVNVLDSSNENTTSNNIVPFDSTSFATTNMSVSNETPHSVNTFTNGKNVNESGSNTDTTTFGKTHANTTNITGRENTPVQDLITKERTIANYNFLKEIANLIVDTICISNFNF